MSYSVHIIRPPQDGNDVPITVGEWNAYIESDPDLRRPERRTLNNSETLVLLPSDSADPDDWQWLSWVAGSIYSDYPQQPMLKKMGQIARYFGAVIMSDDGEIWAIDEDGRVRVEFQEAAAIATEGERQSAKEQAVTKPVIPGIIWPISITTQRLIQEG